MPWVRTLFAVLVCSTVASVQLRAENKSAWVKLCEKAEVAGAKKSICLTHHERLDGNTGSVLVSAAIREVEGQASKHLMAMVPLGMAQAAGLRIAVYSKDQWARAARKEKIDESQLRPISLKYSLCHQAGCTAEIEAKSAFLKEMEAGGGLMVLAINSSGKPVGFPVPLDGFAAAYHGKPVDNAEYAKARGKLLAQIRERQAAYSKQVNEKPRIDAQPQPSPPKLSSGSGAKDVGHRLALVIGNSAYTNAARLNNPARDTKAVAAALRKLGFADVIERYDLGVQQLSAELKAFGDKAAGADWAVVYYAGHGIQVDGQTYLVPTDANLARASHAADEAVPLDRVLAKVADARQMRLVILDACRSNPFLSRMTQAGGTRSLGRGLARVENTSGVLVAYAARDGQVADDGTDEHSPFTKALLEHLEQPGLEIGLLFRKVRDTVLKRTGGNQEPYTYGSIPSEELYFRSVQR